ncbi:HIT domain-containing protein [bacterium]|jgi:histidine triad (HIT) family protein|nr:HIT domain-containing protein [bacterium]MBT6831890.1 HIT domain-containing protein [bacterium]MBT6995980.1 HIT domain-containing protein [bacterium]MBT7772255.1 HIT domain-containing protein [bacterium]
MTFLDTDIFEKIIAGKIPCDKVFETENVLAFRDIAPKAKTHILIVPKKNLVTAHEVTAKNLELFGEFFLVAKKIATQENLAGYKLAMNVGAAGGQVVPHVHLHLLSPDFESPL